MVTTDSKRTILTETISIESKLNLILNIPEIKRHDLPFSLDINDNLSICLAYLDKTNFKNKWKSTNENVTSKKENEYIKLKYKSSFILLVEKLYGKISKSKSYFQNSTHLLNLKKFVYDDIGKKIKLEYDITNLKNLHDILMYSPKSVESYEKILFIFYQLLKLVKYLHSINLNCGEIKLSDIFIDDKYWIRVKLPFENILDSYYDSNEFVNNQKEFNQQEDDDEENEIVNGEKIGYFIIKDKLVDIYESYKHLTHKELSNITKNWCNNKISNFHYLLILNCLAGRKLDFPYNHPIFPWISDFQSINTNLRDLTVSKFRLNKGDPHLDLIYQASGGPNSTSSYHLTEFLSEITYFVYKSRVTSKDTLCNHVRRTWVPNEYPVSISRLYFWTPEECIPEFFCEPEIFKTIHEDLPDLKVPDWCNGSVDEFVRTHRLLLDSDLVSKKLHNWIDLVFGYKLSGEPAIQAKNVCLPLVDNHQTMKPNGIVQLFITPHPYRIDKTYHVHKAPKIINKSRNTNQSFSSSASLQDSDFFRKKTIILNSQEAQINLPDDYNPLALIDQIECLLKFTSKAYNSFPDINSKVKSTYQTIQELKEKDLKSITCLLTEIVLFHKLKCLPQQNNLNTRHIFICKTIMKEPHVISGPFMQIISSVLKPFGDLNGKQNSVGLNKKSKPNVPLYFENINKYQIDFLNVDTLLNMHLTILPFKPYFESLYSFSEIFVKIEYLINEYDNLKDLNNLRDELNRLIEKTACLALNNTNKTTNNQENYNKEEIPKFDLVRSEEQTSSLALTDQIKIDSIYEQIFYLGLLHIPNLMFDICDTKKNYLSQSICATNDLFELILPYILNLFQNPNTCIDSFLYLFEKIARFFSQSELNKKFLPIILQILNVVDLNETLNICLSREDDRNKFCNLFEFNFINQLRIIFGSNVFITEICPFIIEAISGLKDFENNENYSNQNNNNSINNNSNISELSSTPNQEDNKLKLLNNNNSNNNSKKSAIDQNSGIFDMENMNSQINQLTELDEEENYDINNLKNTPKMYVINSDKIDTSISPQSSPLDKSLDLNTKSFIDYKNLNQSDRASNLSILSNNSNLIHTQNTSNNNYDEITKKQSVKISETAFKTFTRIIGSLGPVLTCKYCCNDLIKMIAICYMNNKSLCTIENSDNPLNSVRPIEGDKYSCLLLETLKTVACYYGEQVIVLQYLTHVSNTVTACANRLTIRLEASLLAGVVLVYYFLSYLDIKLLMDNLNYILNYIVLPIINIYSNDKIKFPSGYQMRQVIAFKILDIILIISLRIGPEQTRIELEDILITYFSAFNLVRSKVISNNNKENNTNIVVSTSNQTPPKLSGSLNRTGGFFKNRFFRTNQNSSSQNTHTNHSSISSTITSSTTSKDSNSIKIEKENLNEMDSFDGYLKYSYDQSTNEFIGSSFKTNKLDELTKINNNNNNNNNNDNESSNLNRFSTLGYMNSGVKRLRSQSFGLLRFNSDDIPNNSVEIDQEDLNNLSKPNDLSANISLPIVNNLDDSYTKLLNVKTLDEASTALNNNLDHDEIQNTFTTELAHVSYMCISRLNSGVYIDSILTNSDLIQKMCIIDENSFKNANSGNSNNNVNSNITNQSQKISFSNKQLQLSQSASSKFSLRKNTSGSIGIGNKLEQKSLKNIYASSYGSSFSENVGIIGNQIQIIQEDVSLNSNNSNSNIKTDIVLDYLPNSTRNKFVLKFSENSLKESKAKIDTSRHLTDNWVAYWENAIRINDKKTSSLFDFKQIDLLTLVGHSNAVKSIHVLDNESSIITCSKDKTVKLWSLKNHGVSFTGQKKNIQTCQWTYNQHKKSVFSILFIDSMRVCASCDGSIHIWNPFIGKKIFQMDSQIITSMSSLSAPSASFVVSTADNLIKFVDLRTKTYAHELRTCYAPSGSIRSISTFDNLLLIGFSTGLLFLIDMRTGWIQESWKNLDSKILQVKFFSNDRFLSTYNDGSILISSVKDKVQLQNMIKVYNEPVPYVATTENQIISATSSNKLGIHSFNDDKPNQLSFSMDKLKPDNFKGIISSLNYLPLNKILLIGSDNGEIKQFC